MGNPDQSQNGWVLNQKLIQSTVKQILENPEQFVPDGFGRGRWRLLEAAADPVVTGSAGLGR